MPDIKWSRGINVPSNFGAGTYEYTIHKQIPCMIELKIIVDDTMAAVTFFNILPHRWPVSVLRLAMILHTCIGPLVVLELVVNNQVNHIHVATCAVLYCKQTTVNSLPVCVTIIVILCAHVLRPVPNLPTSQSSYCTMYIELVSIILL